MSEVLNDRQPTILAPLNPALILRQYNGGLPTFTCHIPLWFEGIPRVKERGVRFLADTGCAITSVGLDSAAELGLPLPARSAPEFVLSSSTASGAGEVRVRIAEPRLWWTAELAGEAFVWPIVYLTSPSSRRQQPPLLGLGGVVNTCRWTVVGPASDLLYDGFIQFDDVRAL